MQSGSLEPILCLFGYTCLCVCEMWGQHKKTDKLTNMKAVYSASVRQEILNIYGGSGLQSFGRGDERLRSLTSRTSCWDIGSYQNPVRNRRGWFLLARILQNMSLFPSHITAKEKCTSDIISCPCVSTGAQHDSSTRHSTFAERLLC